MNVVIIISPSNMDLETMAEYLKLMQETNPHPDKTQFLMVIGDDTEWHIKTSYDNEILFEKWKEMYKELNKGT